MQKLPATSLIDRVLAHAPNCPRPLAERTIMDAAREFCESTSVHTEPASLPAEPGNLLYAFDSPSEDFSVVRLKDYSHRGKAVRNALELDSEVKEGDIKATLVLQPSITTRKLYAPLVEFYQEAVTKGALARLLMIPNSAWANPQLAMSYKTQFADEIHNTRIALEQPRQVKPRGRQWAC